MRLLPLISAISIALCYACSSSAPKSPEKTLQKETIIPDRTVSIEDGDFDLYFAPSDTLQLGDIRAGERFERRLRIVNNSSEPLVITHHESACNCATAKYEREPIAPSKYRDVVVNYNSYGQKGWQMKLLKLFFAGKGHPLKIYIDVYIE